MPRAACRVCFGPHFAAWTGLNHLARQLTRRTHAGSQSRSCPIPCRHARFGHFNCNLPATSLCLSSSCPLQLHAAYKVSRKAFQMRPHFGEGNKRLKTRTRHSHTTQLSSGIAVVGARRIQFQLHELCLYALYGSIMACALNGFAYAVAGDARAPAQQTEMQAMRSGNDWKNWFYFLFGVHWPQTVPLYLTLAM